jgi:membrane-bound ClpP family serine protease
VKEKAVSLIAIALLLFVAAMVIFAIDLMIPSGGVLVGLTACFAFAAVVVAFRHSMSSGVWMLIATLGSVPLMLWLFIEVWPRTPLGKRMINTPEPSGDFVWSDAAKVGNVQSLVGSIGIAMNEMIPSGLVQIGEQSFEAFSESGPIEAGKSVRVVRLDVGRLVVVAVRETKPSDAPMSEGTGLDRPISDLNLESLN